MADYYGPSSLDWGGTVDEEDLVPLTPAPEAAASTQQQPAQAPPVPVEGQQQQGEEEPNLLQRALSWATTPGPAEETETPAPTGAPKDATAKWIEENISIPLVDFVDNTFQGNQRTPDQIADDRTELRKGYQERQIEAEKALEEAAYDGPINTFGTEAVRSVVGGLADAVNSTGEALEYGGDWIAAGLAEAGFTAPRDEKDIPWSKSYESAEWDLLTYNGPRTPAGQFAQSTISMLVRMRQLSRAGVKLGPEKTFGGRLVGEQFRGALVDFFESPGKGNLNNLIEDKLAANAISDVLAQDEEDSDLERRLKNSVEGGIFGLGTDLVGELLGALRKGLKARRAGASAKKAAEIAIEEVGSSADKVRDPGFEARKAENDLNSGRPDDPNRPAQFDPQERVTQTRRFDVNESAVSYGKSDRLPGSGKSSIDEVDLQSMKTVEDLQRVISERLPEVDVKLIAKRLRRQPKEYILDTYRTLARYALSDDVASLEPFRFRSTVDVKGVDAGGAVVLRSLVDSATERLTILAKELLDLDEIDLDARTQALQVMDRAEALMVMKKEATQFSSSNLRNWSEVTPELKAKVEEDARVITEQFDEFRRAFADDANPVEARQAKEKFAEFAAGLVASGGDPTKVGSFFSAVRKVGFENITTAYINSLLSGALTTVRNVVGTGYAVTARPLYMALGYAMDGNFAQARLALNAYDAIWKTGHELLQVARASSKSPDSVATASSRFDYTAEAASTARTIDALANTATTPSQKWVANQLRVWHDIVQSPWFSWPSRALQVQDDMFKNLVARMDLRMQAAVEADRIAKSAPMGPDLNQGLKDKIYAELVQKKLGVDGDILDSELLKIADDVTFQTALEGSAKRMAEFIDGSPVLRISIPFKKTPHNLLVFAGEHTPVLHMFLDEWKTTMKYGTANEKAILKGRAAAGYAFASSAMFLSSAGLLTGAGPAAGSDERRLWLRTHEPYSIKVGDKWVRYRDIPGISTVLSITADITQVIQKWPERQAHESMAGLGYAIAAGLVDQSFYAGFLEFASYLDLQGFSPSGVSEGLFNFVNNLFPSGALRRNVENLLNQGVFKQGLYEYKDYWQKTLGAASFGLLGEKVPIIDVLTGEPMQGKYANPYNNLSPFTLVGKDDVLPIVKALQEVDYPIKDSLVRELDDVRLTVSERNIVAKGMYADGKLARDLKELFFDPPNAKTNTFWQSYNAWKNDPGVGPEAIPKEQWYWYSALRELFLDYRALGVQELETSDDPVAKRWRERRPAAAAAAKSGGRAGAASVEQQQGLFDYQNKYNYNK